MKRWKCLGENCNKSYTFIINAHKHAKKKHEGKVKFRDLEANRSLK